MLGTRMCGVGGGGLLSGCHMSSNVFGESGKSTRAYLIGIGLTYYICPIYHNSTITNSFKEFALLTLLASMRSAEFALSFGIIALSSFAMFADNTSSIRFLLIFFRISFSSCELILLNTSDVTRDITKIFKGCIRKISLTSDTIIVISQSHDVLLPNAIPYSMRTILHAMMVIAHKIQAK